MCIEIKQCSKHVKDLYNALSVLAFESMVLSVRKITSSNTNLSCSVLFRSVRFNLICSFWCDSATNETFKVRSMALLILPWLVSIKMKFFFLLPGLISFFLNSFLKFNRIDYAHKISTHTHIHTKQQKAVCDIFEKLPNGM